MLLHLVVGVFITVVLALFKPAPAVPSSMFRIPRSGGFPKFPLDNCGYRTVQWSPQREPRVVGGEIPPLGALPWQVELRIGNVHQCGGTLISNRLVLTAAHCVADGLTVVAGTEGRLESSPTEQKVRVEKIVQHPDFRKLGPYSHDIAVLLLDAPGMHFNDFVKPACFAHETPPAGTWCEVSGWGASDPDAPDRLSLVLRAAAVPLLEQSTCRRDDVYGNRLQAILDTMLCAGHLKGGVDACGGDSGGPLMCEKHGRLELAGIVSWGDGCAKRFKPGVYTKVPNFLSWVRAVAEDLGVDADF